MDKKRNQKIYLVRHGQTDWNINHRCQGRCDTEINETGKRQVKEMGETLSNVKFDYIFCSPLKRTRQTCDIIMSCNTHGGKVVYDNRIIERDFGEFEGLTRIEFDFAGFWNSNSHQVFQKAEGLLQIEKRVNEFLNELKEKTKNKQVNILIVAHGGTNALVQAYFKGIPKDGNYLANESKLGAAEEFYF